jgi:hypothetical protein
MMGPLTAT